MGKKGDYVREVSRERLEGLEQADLKPDGKK